MTSSLPMRYSTTELRRQWAGRDLNPRRQSQRIYSPPPLTTRTPTQVGLRGIEPRSHRYKQWALTNRRQSREQDNHKIVISDCQVPPVGFEPTRLSAVDFESTVSTVSPQGQLESKFSRFSWWFVPHRLFNNTTLRTPRQPLCDAWSSGRAGRVPYRAYSHRWC